jgi:4-diphosphocytidyl-2-C-methyl-D-erythritol kinase
VEPQGLAIGPVEDNLVVRAFRYFWQELGFSEAPVGLDCFITKRIPIGAGLGGGSSDAGAILRALSATFAGALCASSSISHAQLLAAVMRAAARCGADVPYAYTGGVAWVSGIGEVVEPLALPRPWPGLIVIMVPGESVATAAFYQRLRDNRPVISPCVDQERQRFLADPAYRVLEQIVENDFEPEVTQMAPSVAEGLAIARRFFPGGTAVTGSGSAFFSLVPPGREDVLPTLTRELSQRGIKAYPSQFVY